MLDEAKKVTATEANRNFSQIFRRAKEGETIIITDRGEDVVVIGPVARLSDDERARAREPKRKRPEGASSKGCATSRSSMSKSGRVTNSITMSSDEGGARYECH